MTTSEKTILSLKPTATDVLLCAVMLGVMCLALFMNIARQLAGTFKKAVNFV